jgi:hypothetical protein
LEYLKTFELLQLLLQNLLKQTLEVVCISLVHEVDVMMLPSS